VRPVTGEGAELKMAGGVPRQGRHMVTGGGRCGLQQYGGGQGGVGGLRRGASLTEERQSEGEGRGGRHGSPVEAEWENEASSDAQREGGVRYGAGAGARWRSRGGV
jgi:hypothetical protein